MLLRGALPLLDEGGRSVRVMPPRELLVTFSFDGRLPPLLPKPEGARPRSVELPCASQLREFETELPRGEFELLLPKPPRFAFPSAFVRMLLCGLSSESSRCRGDVAPPFAGELLKRPELAGMLLRPLLPIDSSDVIKQHFSTGQYRGHLFPFYPLLSPSLYFF